VPGVAFGAEPLLLAVDDNVVVRRLVAAVVLRWLLVAPDAVFDESHLAVVFGHDTLALHIGSRSASAITSLMGDRGSTTDSVPEDSIGSVS